MIVILDSNAIIADYWLRTRGVQRLLGQASEGELELVVPEVVLLEVVKHFKADLQKAVAAIETADRGAARMIREFGPRAEIDIEADVAEYERFLRTTLTEAGATFESPSVPHAEIARRAVGRHKPFKSSGVGYPDTLVWELAKEKAAEDEVALISDNDADFGGDSEHGGLDRFLEEELDRAGLAGRVRRYPNVFLFNAAHLAHAGVFEAELARRLEEDAEYESAVGEALGEALEGQISGPGAVADETNTEVHAAAVESLGLLAVNGAEPEGYYASFTATGRAQIEFPMLQAEAWEDYEDGTLDDFAVGPDEYLGQAVQTIQFELTAEADYEPDNGELTNWEISWIGTQRRA
jgi:predicted nucleic acid-binding protein